MASPEPSPQILLALMQAGDLTALDVLSRAYGGRLLAVARRRCHRRDEAEDAVQQALLAATSAMTGFRGDGSALAWLQTLVARSCARMNGRGDVVGLAADADADVDCSCDAPDAVAERRQLGQAIGEALMTLSRTDRLAFLLSVEGFSSREIADRFQLSDDAVRSRLKRPRHCLRRALADQADIAPDDTERAAGGTSITPDGASHDADRRYTS